MPTDPLDTTKAYGIFQGGGAKGFAYVGAIKEAEDQGVEFVGVAGTSAGAIVAALLASGYSADELYDPKAQPGSRGVLDLDLSKYFSRWWVIQLLREERKRAKSLASLISKFKAKWVGKPQILLFPFYWFSLGCLWLFVIFCFVLVLTFSCVWVLFRYGIMETDSFQTWLNDRLIEGIRKKKPNYTPNTASGLVLFKDLNVKLKIIASHVSEKKMYVFSELEGYQDVSVAEAVCASVRIPFVFAPKRIQGYYFVDGGLVSNFPAWVFADEQATGIGKLKVLGFSLKEVPSTQNTHRRLGPLEFLFSIGATVMQGQWALSTKRIENLQIISIASSSDLLDFDMDDNSKLKTYSEGMDAAHSFFIS